MKAIKFTSILFSLSILISFNSFGQEAKTPTACKMYLEGKVLQEITVVDALKWCDLVPPSIQCDNGTVYFIETCQVNFFTMKPLQNREFGIGEKGMPIKAKDAVSKANPGDALVLKDVVGVDSAGKKMTMSVISFKLK